MEGTTEYSEKYQQFIRLSEVLDQAEANRIMPESYSDIFKIIDEKQISIKNISLMSYRGDHSSNQFDKDTKQLMERLVLHFRR